KPKPKPMGMSFACNLDEAEKATAYIPTVSKQEEEIVEMEEMLIIRDPPRHEGPLPRYGDRNDCMSGEGWNVLFGTIFLLLVLYAIFGDILVSALYGAFNRLMENF